MKIKIIVFNVCKAFLFLILVLFFNLKTIAQTNKTILKWDKFSMGADLSYVTRMKNNGIKYKDSSKEKDIFEILHSHGCNTVRLRLWHNPHAAPFKWEDLKYSDLQDVEMLMRKAKALGMAVNLDFHYSDSWADPQQQYTPAAWKDLPIKTLCDSVYQYTFSVLKELKSKDLFPEMIQIGNETNGGMLWPVGKVVNNNWTNFGLLLNAGIKAVKDFYKSSSAQPKIILHEAQLQTADNWVNNVINKGGVNDFDIIGLSHYSDWTTVKTMQGVTNTVQQLIAKYHKQVMLVETAYYFDSVDSKGSSIGKTPTPDYPFTKKGQYNYLKDLTQAVINGGGSGLQYWAPDYVSKNGNELTARALFDFNGNALPAIDFMQVNYDFKR